MSSAQKRQKNMRRGLEQEILEGRIRSLEGQLRVHRAFVQLLSDKHTKLNHTLSRVAQTLSWLEHGDCRGFSEEEVLTANEALDLAREAMGTKK